MLDLKHSEKNAQTVKDIKKEYLNLNFSPNLGKQKTRRRVSDEDNAEENDKTDNKNENDETDDENENDLTDNENDETVSEKTYKN